MPARPPCSRLAACLLALLALALPPAAAADTVTVLTWEAFVSPKVTATLKNRENLAVQLVEFSTPEQRERLLREQRGRIDIVVADTVHAADFQRRGLLQKLDAQRLPAARHAVRHWRSNGDYAVPYLWGHTGIAWRTDKVTQAPASYADLFALAAANPGKVSLLDDTHEALRAALYAFGKPPYRMETPADVKAAEALLRRHRAGLRLVGSELDKDSPWLDGSLVAGQAFNGDIAYLRDTYGAPLAFAIPSPGCMVWQEQLLLLADAPHLDAAYRFLALISQAGHAARNAEQVRYAPANPLAVAQLGEAFRKDPVIRPTLDGLEGCYFYAPFDAATQAALDAVKP